MGSLRVIAILEVRALLHRNASHDQENPQEIRKSPGRHRSLPPQDWWSRLAFEPPRSQVEEHDSGPCVCERRHAQIRVEGLRFWVTLNDYNVLCCGLSVQTLLIIPSIEIVDKKGWFW